MMTNLSALCRAYAAHVGLPEPRLGFAVEAERRLGMWPAWARAAALLIAAALRWLAPLLLLGRARPFDALAPDDKEALLAQLQESRWPPMRGAFLMVKTLILGTCYGERSA
ncbi:MAG: hypothetical protein ACHQ49_18005 [Elusimicrobiota bacterium]